MTPRITLKMIANRAGVHFSTVSLALNNHPSIPAATRERLQVLAREMGYRPDPVLASLVAYRMQQQKPSMHGVLAWVDMWPEGLVGGRRLYPALWAGATERAESLGWKLEEFRTAHSGLSPERLSKMLRSRGIDGLLVAPMPGEGAALALDWPAFSVITVGITLTSPRLHRVMPHHVHNMQILMRELHSLGYRRPAFVLDRTINERTQHYWQAAFLDAQRTLPRTHRLEPLMQSFDAAGKASVLAWCRRHRPDVIVSSRADETLCLLESAGLHVPGDIGVASVAFLTESWKPGQRPPSATAGIDERFDTISATTVDTLVGLIHRHERGVPAEAMHILIEGRWCPGRTLRAQNPSASPARLS
ncbi:transcriptional regulator [Opitutaceae bacterium TAV1]|nr:transcriptional regulator [Opitutaceae bacterium TAV1]